MDTNSIDSKPPSKWHSGLASYKMDGEEGRTGRSEQASDGRQVCIHVVVPQQPSGTAV